MASFSRRAFVTLLLCECVAALAIVLVAALAEPGHRRAEVTFIVVLAGLTAIVLLPIVRIAAYRECVPYDSRYDFQYDFSQAVVKTIPISLEDDGFAWPAVEGRFDTALLAFTPTASWLGKWLDPRIVVHCGGSSWEQWFERGVSGLRYLDLTPCLKEPSAGKHRVLLSGHNLRWKPDARLLLFQNNISPAARLLVVAPHPDDAEIAALGLYSRSNASIVTVCAGNAGSASYSQFEGQNLGTPESRAAVRVRESISVPFLAGVHPSRCVNFCYADNSLAELHAGDETKSGGSLYKLETRQLRALNLATDLIEMQRKPESWASLVADLSKAVTAASPDIVVLPHPMLDSHLDHCFVTVAAVEAIRQMARNDIQFLLYIVHPRACESHPIGPTSSVVSLPPNFGQPMVVRGVSSQFLTPEEQSLKVRVLEAMSDLRPFRTDAGLSGAIKDFVGRLYELASGCDRDPHSFFRRAPRPNELFLTATFAEAENIVDQFLKQSIRAVRH